MTRPLQDHGNLSLRTFWGVGLRFVGLALQLATGVLAARVIGPQGFGGYVLAHTIVLLAGGAIHWGQGDLALRVLPTANAPAARRLLRNIVLAFATSVTLAVPMLWLAETAGARLAPGWALVGMLLAAHGGCQSLAALLSASDRVLWVQMVDAVLRPAAVLALLLMAILFDLSPDAALLFRCSIAAAGLSFGLMSVGLAKAWKRRVPGANSADPPGLAEGFPLLATGWSSLLLSQLDHLIVGLVLGNNALGLYRVASRAAGLVGLVHQVATQVLGPRLSRALGAGMPDAARALTLRSARTATTGGLFVATIIVTLTNPYLQILGPDYEQARYLLLLLTLAQICALPFGAGALVLILIRKERLLLKVNFCATVAAAFTLAITASLWGPIGVALAMLVLLPQYKAWLRHTVRAADGPDPAVSLPSWSAVWTKRPMRPKGS